MKLKKEKCRKSEKKEIGLNIRITPSMNKFIKINKLSASAIFSEALESLGYK